MVVAGLRLVAETLPAAVWIILAVYPVALVRMISGLGLRYVVILAVLAGVALLIGLVAKLHLWLMLELAITMFAILSIFSTLAGAVYERVATWPDARYANRLAEQYVDRLLALKRNGEALDVVIQRLRVDAGFRPKSAAATLQIAQLAAQGGGASAVSRMLLRDFGVRFSGDSLVAAATALARHLGE